MTSTLEFLKRKLSEERLSELEREIAAEVDPWFFRLVSTPPRHSGRMAELIRIKKLPAGLDGEILKIFLAERAILKRYEELGANRFIKFQMRWAIECRGLHFAGEQSTSLNHTGVVISEDPRSIYCDFVLRHGLNLIQEAVQRLVDDSYLTRERTPDGKSHYYLLPEAFCFDLERSEFTTFWDLKQRLLLVAGLHTSEIRGHARERVERGFQSNEIHFVMATPTLEMGIDIGKLQNILLVGVPPLPSNYAQRAGRAGRGSNANFALIVTFCSESENHDVYYFNSPARMIEGAISPPSFDPANVNIIKKHLNAFILSGKVDKKESLLAFFHKFDGELRERLDTCQEVFGRHFDVWEYLSGEFKETLRRLIGNVQACKGPVVEFLYSSGFFPDHSFRRDSIGVIDRDSEEANAAAPDAQLFEDQCVSRFEVEQAYYKFSPGRVAFLAGDAYRILPEGDYQTMSDSRQVETRSYKTFFAEKEVRHATRSADLKKYDLSQGVIPDAPFNDRKEVLKLTYSPALHIKFRNRGVRKYQEVKPFSDGLRRFILGYDLERAAIVFEFDREIDADLRLCVSLLSALDRTIKYEFGLDESEIRLLIDVELDRPSGTPEGHEEKAYAVLYDYDGNGNVPLRACFDRFDEVIASTYERLARCACEGGCYSCTRSYNTQFYARNIDKGAALMFTGYLLGKNVFQPEPPAIHEETGTFDLTLNVALHGHRVTVNSGRREYVDVISDSKNATIFNLLIQAIRAEYKAGMASLKVTSNQRYLIDAINGGQVNQGGREFAGLLFNLLRFKTFKAERSLRR